MRRAALLLAVALAGTALSGCLHQGDFTVVSVQGTIEGGGEAEEACELPTPDGSIALDDEAVHWAEPFGLVPDALSERVQGPTPFSLLLFTDVSLPADGCGPRDELIAGDETAEWRYAHDTLALHVPVERGAEGAVTVNGTELAPGDTTEIEVNRTTTTADGEQDRYTGTLTVTAHGTWSGDAFQVVGSPFVSDAETAYWS
jgi:hypothetical protein